MVYNSVTGGYIQIKTTGVKMLKKILEFSWAYELAQNIIGARRLRRFYINDIVRPSPGISILDVGCGPGVMVPYLKGVKYYGIDINPRYIEKAAKKYVSADVSFKCADVSEIGKLEGLKYDIVMMNGVLHHLDDPQADACMAAIKNLLKPGGRFTSFDGVYYGGISAAEKFVLDHDRGKFVRTPEQYASIIRKHLPEARYAVKKWMTNIPNPLIFFY
jgi:2-polyprenyl-3-methyl-5-hydroxy-6-metoxy-1,4-benzoquinol methylase